MSSGSTASTARAPVAGHLARRRQPVQERARHTVEQILDTAAALLEEAGVEAFNTNVLADRAAVRVRTVYRYFPNKLAVITAVAERLAHEWDSWFDRFQALADPNSDWRALWVAYVDAFVGGIRKVPGGLAIRRAMRALPELQAIDRQDNERLARQLAVALSRRGIGLPRRRLNLMSRILVETAVTVLDLALFEPPARARALIEELKCLQLGYLEASVEGRPAAETTRQSMIDPSEGRRSPQ
jgi:AcrR family transcriptional regulator